MSMTTRTEEQRASAPEKDGTTEERALREDLAVCYLEQACEVQLLAMASGGRVRLAPSGVREHTARQWERIDETTGTAYVLPEWSALRRWLDRNDPGYRE